MTAPGALGFGIVGAGMIAPTHARAIASLPQARLRAVADVDLARAERLAGEFGAAAHGDVDALLERSEVDVVCVCVPSGLHADIGARAAEAGKHVVVEKPIDVSLAAADRLIARCRERGVTLSVISQHRFDTGARRLREALDAGRLGRVLTGDAFVRWYRSPAYYRSAGWRATWDLDGGGALMNQGIHSVDVLLWLLGPVDSVTAHTATVAHDIAVEDVAVALLRFASGAFGVIEATTAAFPGFAERIEVSGTRGGVVLESGAVAVWEAGDDGAHVGPYGKAVRLGSASPAPAATAVDGHAAQLRDVIDAIESRREPAVTGDDGRRALELVLAIYESARSGRSIAPLSARTR